MGGQKKVLLEENSDIQKEARLEPVHSNESKNSSENELNTDKSEKVKEKKQLEAQSIQENAECGETYSNANQKKEKGEFEIAKEDNRLTDQDLAEKQKNENELKDVKGKKRVDEKLAKLNAKNG